nr:hypothetical protein Iba_chr14aCG3070 [Ipomoea batatas]
MMESSVFCDDDQEEDHHMLEPIVEDMLNVKISKQKTVKQEGEECQGNSKLEHNDLTQQGQEDPKKKELLFSIAQIEQLGSAPTQHYTRK